MVADTDKASHSTVVARPSQNSSTPLVQMKEVRDPLLSPKERKNTMIVDAVSR